MSKPRLLLVVQSCVIGAVPAAAFEQTGFAVLLAATAVLLAQWAKEEGFVSHGPQRIRFSERIRQKLRSY